jgi:TatD DNase family protein
VLVDAHCHLDRFPDPLQIAKECERAKLTTVAVTHLPSHYQLALPHVHRMPHIKLGLGLHPLAVAEGKRELGLFLKLLPDVDFVGEIGLDFSREGYKTKASQLAVFEEIVEALGDRKRFVSLHSRGSAEELLDVLERHRCRDVVLHWFTGSRAALERAIDLGCGFSVNSAMTNSKSGRELISRMPRDRVMTETDAPYVQTEGRPAVPQDVKRVLAFLGLLWDMPALEAETLVFSNFGRATGLSSR